MVIMGSVVKLKVVFDVISSVCFNGLDCFKIWMIEVMFVVVCFVFLLLFIFNGRNRIKSFVRIVVFVNICIFVDIVKCLISKVVIKGFIVRFKL